MAQVGNYPKLKLSTDAQASYAILYKKKLITIYYLCLYWIRVGFSVLDVPLIITISFCCAFDVFQEICTVYYMGVDNETKVC